MSHNTPRPDRHPLAHSHPGPYTLRPPGHHIVQRSLSQEFSSLQGGNESFPLSLTDPAFQNSSNQVNEYPSLNGVIPGYNPPYAGAVSNGPSALIHSPPTDAAPPQYVTTIANLCRLNAENRDVLHMFNLCTSQEKLIHLQAQLLKTSQDIILHSMTLKAVTDQVVAMTPLLTQSWSLNDSQKKPLRDLVRHFLTKPCISYTNVIGDVQTYITKWKVKLDLVRYPKPAVKTVIDAYLKAQINNQKNQFHKAVFKSVNERIDLVSFAEVVIRKYHTPLRPKEVPIPVLGQLAKACELTGTIAQSDDKPDFWPAFDKILKSLSKTNGPDHKSPTWASWDDHLIKTDKIKYPDIGSTMELEEDKDGAEVQEGGGDD
ncbi:hypothetical protein JAAARDRAFT_197213 [Jaapia argillacea MUCL 33604]|uniref:Uncharacterized protein n=1 Tax=Jaapia argillacea MUCL 33604 TaxID=933084 RepID=A0A067PR35_9AGAM|nr:hypothetical protein JAAARDRAFT_197213 [Jaapia argillacea MUCL 33604]